MSRIRRTVFREPTKQICWMVTLSDLLILLLTFFVLLISMSSMDMRAFRRIFGAFPAALGILEMGGGSLVTSPDDELIEVKPERVRRIVDLAALRKLSPKLSLLLDRLEEEAATRRLRVAAVDDDLRLRIAGDHLFGTLDAGLRESGEALLEVLGRFAAGQPGAVTVEVYTDNFPLSTAAFADNWDLAAARGEIVVRQLIRRGVAAQRLRLTAFGPDNPAVVNDTAGHRAENRRIVIVISDWVRERDRE
ncbi:MAG: OmpA family protein [Deltaproteobacteria bacterium]|nr:OmpA family protein [Candidatus Anaeroferrophillacea bacterium]